VVVLLALFTVASAAQIVIPGSLTHEREADPGESYSGSILLRNGGEQARDVRVYRRDYSFDHTGAVRYPDPRTITRSNAEWVDFSPTQVTLAGGTSDEIRYTIQVPPNEELSGTYWSVLMVEPLPSQDGGAQDGGSRDEEDADETQLGVRQVLRYAVQMITHIRDSGTRSLEILNAELQYTEDGAQLQLDVTNTGTRLLRTLVWAELYRENGERVARVEGRRKRIYPETSARFKLDMSALSPGEYRSLVVLDAGDETVFGARYNLVIRERE
jgi:hypothetical protein